MSSSGGLRLDLDLSPHHWALQWFEINKVQVEVKSKNLKTVLEQINSFQQLLYGVFAAEFL